MSSKVRYDLVMIGAGSAAFAAAIRGHSLGARVALVERGTVGGTCTNVGCIPSKHLLAASHAYRSAGHHRFEGVSTSQGDVSLAQVVAKKDAVIRDLRQEKYLDLADGYGFDILRGHARFAGRDRPDVDGRDIEAERIIIATGSAPWIPPIEGLAEVGYLTSTSAMELLELPESLVVIGGNYIGLELGQVFANLGSKVTIVEALDRIAPLEEPEISEALTRVLHDQGIEVVTSATVRRAEHGSTKTFVGETTDGEVTFDGAEILVATGRRPVLDGLDLEKAGIARDHRGSLVLDEFCTLVYATLRPERTGILMTLARGGHPPPIILTGEGEVRALEPPGELIGVFEDSTFEDQTVELRSGDTALFYTDGVVERDRGEHDEAVWLSVIGSFSGLGPTAIVERIERLLEDAGPLEDDVAVLVLGVTESG